MGQIGGLADHFLHDLSKPVGGTSDHRHLCAFKTESRVAHGLQASGRPGESVYVGLEIESQCTAGEVFLRLTAKGEGQIDEGHFLDRLVADRDDFEDEVMFLDGYLQDGGD